MSTNSQLWNLHKQAKKVRKKCNLLAWSQEKRITINSFLEGKYNTGPASGGKKKKSWFLILHFTTICPNFVWLIALNCLVFEKQQQLKRKLSAGEKNTLQGRRVEKGEKALLIQLVIWLFSLQFVSSESTGSFLNSLCGPQHLID